MELLRVAAFYEILLANPCERFTQKKFAHFRLQSPHSFVENLLNLGCRKLYVHFNETCLIGDLHICVEVEVCPWELIVEGLVQVLLLF